jgi:hypothetical protein
MSNDAVVGPTSDIVNELRTQADTFAALDRRSAERLRRLAAALEQGGPAAEVWAGSSVQQLLDTSALAGRLQAQPLRNRWVVSAEIVRNVAILLPIIVTWFGIDQAVKAYGALLAADPTRREEPFLALWQRGFDGYLSWYGLETMAALLIGTLCVVIVLTAWSMGYAHLLEGRAAADAEQRILALEDLLVRTAQVIRVSVRPAFALATEQIERIGSSLIDQLQAERARIDSLAQQRERELLSFTEFTGRLENSTLNLVSAAAGVERSYSDLSGGLSGLVSAVSDLQRTTELINGEVQRLLTPLSDLVAGQTTVGERLAVLMPELERGAGSAAAAALRAAEVTEQIQITQQQQLQAAAADRAMQAELMEKVRLGVIQLDATAAQFNGGTLKLTEGIRHLDGRLATLDAPLEQLSGTTAQLAGTAGTQVRLLTDLNDLQQSAVDLLNAAAADAAKAAETGLQAQREQRQYVAEAARDREQQQLVLQLTQAVLQQLSGIVATFDTGSQRLTTTFAALDQQLSGLSKPLETLTDEAGNLSQTGSQQITHLRQLTDEQLRAAQTLGALLTRLNGSDERFQATLAAVKGYSDTMQQTFQRTVGERDAVLTQLAQRLQDDSVFGHEALIAASELRNVAAALQDAVESLRVGVERLTLQAADPAPGETR